MAPERVAGDLYVDIDGQMWEIKRQLRQKTGYPYDPMHLVDHLQAAIEGNLVDRSGRLFQKTVEMPINQPLLAVIGTVTIPATAEPFVARNKFVVDTNGAVKISFLGSKFQKWFLGKTEEPMAVSTLRYAKLLKFSIDGPILKELGGTVETTLAHVFALMERQPNGEEGVLLTNGWTNIFYVRDINGTLRAMFVSWLGGGWRVSADSVENPDRWHVGLRVFSRNS